MPVWTQALPQGLASGSNRLAGVVASATASGGGVRTSTPASDLMGEALDKGADCFDPASYPGPTARSGAAIVVGALLHSASSGLVTPPGFHPAFVLSKLGD